jgi:hypothetical protein
MIRRSLVLATCIAEDETPTAEQLADGLADMNDLVAAWQLEGLNCGGPYVATDELAVPDSFMRALRFNLAVELAPSYGVSAQNVMIGRNSLADIADKAKALAQGVSMDVPDAVFDGPLQAIGWNAGNGWWWRP